MKTAMDLNEIYVNQAQIELLTGQVVNPASVLGELEIEYKGKNPKCTLQQLKDSMLLKKTQCFDERYDKQDPIDMAIAQVREKGLNRNLLEKIVTTTACIEKVRLVGIYEFLTKILTDEQLGDIKRMLGKAQFHLLSQGKLKKTKCVIYDIVNHRIAS